MGSDSVIIEIIILAMVALFIGLRLRSVLGKHRADEPPAAHTESYRGRSRAGADPRAPMGLGKATFDESETLNGSDNPVIRKIFGHLGPAGYAKFLDGAKSAYKMTLKGFWAGEMGEMEPWIDPPVLNGFKSAIAARNKKGHRVENRLVEIVETRLEDAEILDQTAEITLGFKSEIVFATYDGTGKLVEGNVSDTVTVTDFWTFARHLKSKDPNWVLVATQSA